MIVTRAPYRVSFFGGGSDYREWYSVHGGAFLSTAIDHHVYISLRRKSPFGGKRFRVLWRLAEEVSAISEIQHPVVRAALQELEISTGVDITYFGDLPSGTGIGSSSSFTVALLLALGQLLKRQPSELELAQQAIALERDRLGETVGVQDQIAAAFGGMNYVRIGRDGQIRLERVLLSRQRREELDRRLVLMFTGVSRHASKIAEAKVKNLQEKEAVVARMQEMARIGYDLLREGSGFDGFGDLLHEAWEAKRSLTDRISNDAIDEMYAKARAAGALGGKLLGAGGGGFMLFFVRDGEREKFIRTLGEYAEVPFRTAAPGAAILVNEPHWRDAYYDRIWADIADETPQARSERERRDKNGVDLL